MASAIDPAGVRVRPLAAEDLDEADRICRVAFGTFLGVPEPEKTFGEADLVRARWQADPGAALAADADGRLAGSNFAANWGSVGVFGPLSVAPEYWDRAIAQRLLDATMDLFAARGTRHAGLFTFAQSAKQGDRVGPGAAAGGHRADRRRRSLQGVAVCHVGPGTEAGSGACYVKFGAVRPGPAAERMFGLLIDACHALAAERGASLLVAGANAGRTGPGVRWPDAVSAGTSRAPPCTGSTSPATARATPTSSTTGDNGLAPPVRAGHEGFACVAAAGRPGQTGPRPADWWS